MVCDPERSKTSIQPLILCSLLSLIMQRHSTLTPQTNSFNAYPLRIMFPKNLPPIGIKMSNGDINRCKQPGRTQSLGLHRYVYLGCPAAPGPPHTSAGTVRSQRRTLVLRGASPFLGAPLQWHWVGVRLRCGHRQLQQCLLCGRMSVNTRVDFQVIKDWAKNRALWEKRQSSTEWRDVCSSRHTSV